MFNQVILEGVQKNNRNCKTNNIKDKYEDKNK